MRRFFSLPALGLLAGCLGQPIVGPTTLDLYTSYDGARFAGNGQLLLVGSAFGAAGTPQVAATAAERIAEGAMSKTSFLLLPKGPEDELANNRVVVVIGGGNGAGLCTLPPPERGSDFTGGELKVVAAACSGTSRLSSTSGSIDGVTGPDDPKIARLFSQIGTELFPPRNPDREEPSGQDWSF